MNAQLAILIFVLLLFQPAFSDDGDGSVSIQGELKQWHKVSIILSGPHANETDTAPNPFTDYNFEVKFQHLSSGKEYVVPGFFAADGKAGESSAKSGNKWQANFSPNQTGTWNYQTTFVKGKHAAIGLGDQVEPIEAFNDLKGSFQITESDKSGRDFRARGRLEYVGERYLKFAGDGSYFLKAGPDAPETLLAYQDFDGTRANNPKKGPLKSWQAHVSDWQKGDPAWQENKGKGLIGALNYLASKGLNSVSFLPYNAGGDGDNVWPFIERDKKLHYDCSKLDQWEIVFAHATANGLHLHFKLQETEIDDNRNKKSKDGIVPTSLDGGKLEVERRLYCREIVARFSHHLALNWNISEESTQTTEEIKAMGNYLAELDPYDHHIVIHTYPGDHDKVYTPLLGVDPPLTGASLQTSWDKVHQNTYKWIKQSAKSGKPWVVANDEQNPANIGVPPDPGYKGFDGKTPGKTQVTIHDIRRNTLWGNIMAGGAGVEYYFGYKLPENDLLCEDFRSRDQSWDFCNIALRFLADNQVPFWKMDSSNSLVGNDKNNNALPWCLSKDGEHYLIFVPEKVSYEIDLPNELKLNSAINAQTGESLTPDQAIKNNAPFDRAIYFSK